MAIKNIRKYLLVVFAVSLMSCSLNFDVNEPVDLIWDKLDEKSTSLIIFLPGLIDNAETFKNEQFFSIARNAGIKADMVSASIHIGHLIKDKMIKRLEVDVYNEAKNNGYKNIWLVGVSIGGLNSLLFYQKYMHEICGVVTVSPYVADTALREDLQQAGSVKNWKPKPTENMKIFNQKLQSLWVWFQKQYAKNSLTNIYLGYGKQDKYAKEIKLLENILDKNNVTLTNGKHNWVSGQKIWQQQLLTRAKTGLLKPCR